MFFDLRYAWRGIRKARGFTAIILITLALGLQLLEGRFFTEDERVPNLVNPETIQNYEAGIKSRLAQDTLLVNLAAFKYKVDDAQYDRTYAITVPPFSIFCGCDRPYQSTQKARACPTTKIRSSPAASSNFWIVSGGVTASVFFLTTKTCAGWRTPIWETRCGRSRQVRPGSRAGSPAPRTPAPSG